MTVAAAGAIQMWMGGLFVGIGAATGTWMPMLVGSIVSLWSLAYIKRFAEKV